MRLSAMKALAVVGLMLTVTAALMVPAGACSCPWNWYSCPALTNTVGSPAASPVPVIRAHGTQSCSTSASDNDAYYNCNGSCSPSYWHADNCYVQWTASGPGGSGSFTSNGVGQSVTWTAPCVGGSYTITCTAGDGRQAGDAQHDSNVVVNRSLTVVSTDSAAGISGPDVVCVDGQAEFSAQTIPPGHESMLNWSGGGSPATGSGASFQTSWDTPGTKTVTVQTSSDGCDAVSKQVKVVKAEVKSVTFTSDHGVLTDWDTNYAGSGGTVYSPRGWQKGNPDVNNPITHTQGLNISASVVICVQPSGVSYTLKGDGTIDALDFQSTATSTGADQSIAVISTGALPAKVDILENQSITWKVKDVGGQGGPTCDAGTSGPHKIYVTWDSPGAGPTVHRIKWSCTQAQGATSITSAAVKFRDAVASSPGYASPRLWELNSWTFVDTGSAGDCITLAKLCAEGLKMIGIPATERWSYATNDTTSSWSNTTCTSQSTTGFLNYHGHLWNARAIYPGNNFEGFFTVKDPAPNPPTDTYGHIKAYTVYTPAGPFEKQCRYYLQVLNYVTTECLWIANGYQSQGSDTFNDGDEIPVSHWSTPDASSWTDPSPPTCQTP